MTTTYARCPHCRTVFGLTPEELAGAPEQMRCGNCLKPFAVRAHLLKDLPRDEAVMPEPLPAPVDARVPAAEHGDRFRLAPETRDVLPRVLVGDVLRPGGGRWRRAAALLTLVVLAGLLALQAALFHPAAVAGLTPRLAPVVERVMPWRERVLEALGKGGEAFRDLGRIRLVSRDVRSHPRIPGALLARAVMVNRAPLAQPFPDLEFTLYDVNGGTLASRQFPPSEYLGDTAGELMRPGQPVQFELQLLAPETDAVGFEFRFH